MATPLAFDADWYLRQNPDVAAAVQAGSLSNAYDHFMLYGRDEGRSGSPLFDTQYYLQQYQDVAQAVAEGLFTAWDHFVSYGGDEGRSPTPLFDPQYYLQRNPDVAAALAQGSIQSATQHFLAAGLNELRAITPGIDLRLYASANADVMAAAVNGQLNVFDHLLLHGVYEGRSLGNGLYLSMFSSDPVFSAALAANDSVGALMRVGAVAPFIPAFEQPPGFTLPANTPLPLDFVPPAGSGLLLEVPSGVTVPPGTVLPPSFKPLEPTPAPTPAPPPTPAPAPSPDDGSDPGPAPVTTFTVDVNLGALTFGGTATGQITFTVASDGVATFVRQGVTASAKHSISTFSPAGGTTIYLGTDVTGLSYLAARDLEKLLRGGDFSANDKTYTINDSIGKVNREDFSGGSYPNIAGITLSGSAGQEVVTGSRFDDVINGGADDDTITGGAGADVIDGEDGLDTVSYADVTAADSHGLAHLSGVAVNLSASVIDAGTIATAMGGTVVLGGGAGVAGTELAAGSAGYLANEAAHSTTAMVRDTLRNVENVDGSSLADYIVGSAENNVINGGDGADVIYGGAGDDTINGGEGADIITGGVGADIINGGTGVDTYVYTSVQDSQVLGGPNSAATGFDTVIVTTEDKFSFDLPITHLMTDVYNVGSDPIGVNGDALLEYLTSVTPGDVNLEVTGLAFMVKTGNGVQYLIVNRTGAEEGAKGVRISADDTVIKLSGAVKGLAGPAEDDPDPDPYSIFIV